MNQSKEEILTQAITVTAEIVAIQLSANALDVMVEDLMNYELDDVLNALNRCRKELSGRLTLAEIVKRIDTGWVSADEAFNAIVQGWQDERVSIITTETALEASGEAYELFRIGDKTGARMAFKNAYERLVAEKKSRFEKAKWTISQGLDKEHFIATVNQAVQKGLISKQSALLMLPSGIERVEIELGRALNHQEKQQGTKHTQAILLMLKKKVC